MTQMTLIAIGSGLILLGLALLVTGRVYRAKKMRAMSRSASQVVAAHPAPAGIERPMAILRVPVLSAACDHARSHVGKTFDALTAPALPMPGCNHTDCQCRYERAINRRRGERRVHSERRDEIRFQDKNDRRKNSDRRKANRTWTTSV